MDARICPRCNTTFPLEHTTCPNCNYVLPAFSQKPKRVVHKFSYYAFICLSLGLAAGIFAGMTEAILTFPIFLPALEQPTSVMFILVAVIVAPLVEEPMKLLGLFVVDFSENVTFGLRRWVILGVFGALGFSLFENVLYALTVAMSYGWHSAGVVFAARILLSLPFHMIASAVGAYGYGLFTQKRKVGCFLTYLAIAILIHSLFNFVAMMV